MDANGLVGNKLTKLHMFRRGETMAHEVGLSSTESVVRSLPTSNIEVPSPKKLRKTAKSVLLTVSCRQQHQTIGGVMKWKSTKSEAWITV
jgi:hypothetical protein